MKETKKKWDYETDTAEKQVWNSRKQQSEGEISENQIET